MSEAGAAVARAAAAMSTSRTWRLAWRTLRNPLSLAGLGLIAALVLTALLAPVLAPSDPLRTEMTARLQPPSRAHPFGTDQLGRDVLSRVLHGARITLRIAILTAVVATAIGLPVGVLSGYFRGRTDDLLMRLTDMFMAFPRLILAMAIAAALRPSLENVILAISLAGWPIYARLARSMALAIREEVYIEAARALGASAWRILTRHVLPGVVSPVIIQVSLDMGGIILTAAGLGFIGFGAQPPTPEWGLMISEGRNYVPGQWWLATFPGLAISLVVLGFNLLGDGIRDVLDPRLRTGRG
ncbi:MAG: ABC transporter permease [Armatimonadota bacterium]|nr:ABC transporter permease [Armatimonadota bacterium]MDR7449060.1 ABC transporter permease [Armatimonadota bacterium]MDR7459432.1 ABC transporter permease [Armatimonadota bacterium]MDR7480203.1 ABC transporter permease [Armatimonadota bacterium]MDR7487988.1 ABC transporter permease [Armatimonadota bacterium]